MGIFSIIGNLGLGDFDESKILMIPEQPHAAGQRNKRRQSHRRSWRKKHCLIRLMNARFVI